MYLQRSRKNGGFMKLDCQVCSNQTSLWRENLGNNPLTPYWHQFKTNKWIMIQRKRDSRYTDLKIKPEGTVLVLNILYSQIWTTNTVTLALVFRPVSKLCFSPFKTHMDQVKAVAIRPFSYPFAWFRYSTSCLLNRRSLIPRSFRPATLKLIRMVSPFKTPSFMEF